MQMKRHELKWEVRRNRDERGKRIKCWMRKDEEEVGREGGKEERESEMYTDCSKKMETEGDETRQIESKVSIYLSYISI